jgi:hypothetical protein
MAKFERMRQEVPESFGSDDIARQAEQGWKLVAVEWQREVPAGEESSKGTEVPFGLKVAQDPPRLEENPAEQEILFTMMELVVQDGPYSAVADELNRRGYRTREGFKWTAVSVFQMLPRLIEVGPRIFATHEWQQRRLAASGQF